MLVGLLRTKGGGLIDFDAAISRLGTLLSGIGAELFRAASRVLEVAPFSELILAIPLWALIGQLLSGSGETAEGKAVGGARLRLIEWWRSLTLLQRHRTSIAVVFLLGIYLSIAAIVAIPYFQDDKVPQALTRERLEGLLSSQIRSDSRPAVAATTRPDPLAELGKRLDQLRQPTAPAEAASAASAAARAGLDPAVFAGGREYGLVRKEYDAIRGIRETALSQYSSLSEQLPIRQKQVVAKAGETFDLEMQTPMSSAERLAIFQAIQRSAATQLAGLDDVAQECSKFVSDLDARLEQYASETNAAIARTIASVRTGIVNERSWFGFLTYQFGPQESARVCKTAVRAMEYQAPEPGLSWGPFGVVARWLLRTHSEALALITGMLGFGLLGSAIATFVRGTIVGAGSDSIAGEAGTVVVRGLSAAIVVFLAVKGGLGVFSSGEVTPNAYVLFFTCLVGAVFSEEVWKWARSKLGTTLLNERQETNEPRSKDEHK